MKCCLLKSKIPSEYQQVEYIESTGTQWIDTGAYITKNTSFSCDFAMVRNDGYGYCSIIGGTSGTMRAFIAQHKIFFNVGNSSYYSDYTPTSGTKYNITMDANLCYINSDLVYTGDASTITENSATINLFAEGNGVIWGACRIYHCQIYDNGTLVRDFIPAMRKSDNVIGLYDIVNGVFYTNAGTGTFLKGNVTSYEIQKCKVNIFKENQNSHNLPSEYQEVDYIQSSGTQYVDTGVAAHVDIKTVAKFSVSDLTASKNYIFGSVNSGVSRIQFSYSNPLFIGWGNRYENSISWDVDTNIHTVELGRWSNLKIDDTVAYTTGYGYFVNGLPIYLFALNSTRTPSDISNGVRIYECQIYDNSTLVRDFVPCYRISDNVAGLYDMVNDVFYTNAGTGVFTKGSNISNYNVQNVKNKLLDTQMLPINLTAMDSNGNLEGTLAYNGTPVAYAVGKPTITYTTTLDENNQETTTENITYSICNGFNAEYYSVTDAEMRQGGENKPTHFSIIKKAAQKCE